MYSYVHNELTYSDKMYRNSFGLEFTLLSNTYYINYYINNNLKVIVSNPH